MMGINMMNIFLYNYLTEKTYLLQQQILVGAQNQHYEDVLKKQQELRTLKHDLKNLLLGLNYHVYNENLEEAKLLLKEITAGSIDTYVSYTECWPIDTILSSKISQMKKQNVQFALELKVPVDLTIDDKVVDICAILGNILDNAIEECVRIESELQINICIYYHEKN